MQVTKILTEEDAVSSAIGVVLMVAVTVILAAAVGGFVLDLAGSSTKKTPSASVEVKWGVDGGFQTVDITVVGGNELKTRQVTVRLEETTIWDDSGTASDFQTYDGNKWTGPSIKSGETLGLKETVADGFQNGERLKIVWSNGGKSQVLGTSTVQ